MANEPPEQRLRGIEDRPPLNRLWSSNRPVGYRSVLKSWFGNAEASGVWMTTNGGSTDA